MRSIFYAASSILVAAALMLLPRGAMAGPLATAFAAGDLAGAEARREQGPADDDDNLAKCRLLLLENRLAGAAACFRQRLARKPDDKVSLAGLARAAFRAGDFAQAETVFARAGQALDAAEAAALTAVPAYHIASHDAAYSIAFFRLDPLPLLYVKLPDGRDHAFVLDTGAAETILDPAVAAAAHVTPIAGVATGTYAGGRTAPVQRAMLGELALGHLAIEHVPVQLLATAPFAAELGAPVEGVLGVDIIRHFIATINYPMRRLELRLPRAGLAQKGASQPFWIAGSHFLLAEGGIDGVRELALLDTGLAGQGCSVPRSTLDEIGQAPHGPGITGAGGGGSTTATAFTARSVSLGTMTQLNVACLFGPFPPTIETMTGARIGLLVSHAFLERYAVTFDFPAMRLWLRSGTS